jgi:hypothetical protein
MVESGNGRVLAVRSLYTNPDLEPQRDAYLAWLHNQGVGRRQIPPTCPGTAADDADDARTAASFHGSGEPGGDAGDVSAGTGNVRCPVDRRRPYPQPG